VVRRMRTVAGALAVTVGAAGAGMVADAVSHGASGSGDTTTRESAAALGAVARVADDGWRAAITPATASVATAAIAITRRRSRSRHSCSVGASDRATRLSRVGADGDAGISVGTSHTITRSPAGVGVSHDDGVRSA